MYSSQAPELSDALNFKKSVEENIQKSIVNKQEVYVPLWTEEELQKAQENGALVFSYEGLSKFICDIKKAVDNKQLSTLEIEKAKKDLSRLAMKRVTDKNGHQRIVYVKVSEDGKKEIDFQQGDEVAFEHNGKKMSGVVKSLKFSEQYDKFGTAVVKTADGAVYTKSLRALSHANKAKKTTSEKTKPRKDVMGKIDDFLSPIDTEKVPEYDGKKTWRFKEGGVVYYDRKDKIIHYRKGDVVKNFKSFPQFKSFFEKRSVDGKSNSEYKIGQKVDFVTKDGTLVKDVVITSKMAKSSKLVVLKKKNKSGIKSKQDQQFTVTPEQIEEAKSFKENDEIVKNLLKKAKPTYSFSSDFFIDKNEDLSHLKELSKKDKVFSSPLGEDKLVFHDESTGISLVKFLNSNHFRFVLDAKAKQKLKSEKDLRKFIKKVDDLSKELTPAKKEEFFEGLLNEGFGSFKENIGFDKADFSSTMIHHSMVRYLAAPKSSGIGVFLKDGKWHLKSEGSATKTIINSLSPYFGKAKKLESKAYKWTDDKGGSGMSTDDFYVFEK